MRSGRVLRVCVGENADTERLNAQSFLPPRRLPSLRLSLQPRRQQSCLPVLVRTIGLRVSAPSSCTIIVLLRLRGHCLKGENRCDFAHEIPHVLNARLQMLDAQNEGRRSPSWESIAAAQEAAAAEDPEMAEFPSLGDSAGRQRSPKGQNDYFGDPSRSRWAGAVKNGRPVDPRAGRYDAARGTRSPFEGFVEPDADQEDGEVRPRQSQRVALRPAALLPTLPTGSSLAQLYANYRAGFLELGAQRNKCFQRANECFKRGGPW